MQKNYSTPSSPYNPITEGVIWKEVLFLFIPIVISAFFQHLYTFVDGMIIGAHLGDVAFSAVGGSASKLITMVINFFVGVSSGITAYTARFYGAKDMVGVKQVVFNGLSFFVALGAVLSVLGIVLAEQLLTWMGTPEETFALATVYLRTFLGGILFCVLYNTLSGILRAMGDSKRPLYVLIFCSFVNIALDIFFVVGLHLGVLGVAVATLLAQGISAVALGYLLWKSLPKTANISYRINPKMVGEICAIGIPAGCQSMMYSLSNILVQSAINGFGYVTVTAWSAYVKIDSIVDIFVSALGGTVITFVGQNLGAGRLDRVRQSVRQIIAMSYGITGVLMVVFMALRFELLGLFTQSDDVLSIGGQLFFIIMPMYLLGIPQTMFAQALRGLGKSMVPMILTLVGVIGVRVLWVTVLFPLQPSIYFLAACYPVSATLMSVIFTVYYGKTAKKIAPKTGV